MVNFVSSARSGSDWSRNELLAYRITVAPIQPQEFFPHEADPPLKGLDPTLINTPLDLDDANVLDDTYRFLACLKLATNGSQETATDDFARELLRVAGFEECGRILRTHTTIPLFICGENNTVAQTHVCLVDRRSNNLARSTSEQNKFQFFLPKSSVRL